MPTKSRCNTLYSMYSGQSNELSNLAKAQYEEIKDAHINFEMSMSYTEFGQLDEMSKYADVELFCYCYASNEQDGEGNN